MILDPSAISSAFAQYIQRYGKRKDWKISDRCECWAKGQDAFDCDSLASFDQLHRTLRGYWQVFRNSAGPCWSASEAFGHMKQLDQTYRRKCLSQCSQDDIPALWQVLRAMSPIKPTKSGPSVVAISKFLHFWNPRLFVIVDDAMVWQRVISSHWWLWQEMVAARQVVDAALPGQRGDPTDAKCDLVSYLAILLWAGQIIRDNPTVPTVFAQHCVDAPSEFSLSFAEYEAAGLEWLLLGLAELPPPGVHVSSA